jgi:hypothetical protein
MPAPNLPHNDIGCLSSVDGRRHAPRPARVCYPRSHCLLMRRSQRPVQLARDHGRLGFATNRTTNQLSFRVPLGTYPPSDLPLSSRRTEAPKWWTTVPKLNASTALHSIWNDSWEISVVPVSGHFFRMVSCRSSSPCRNSTLTPSSRNLSAWA